MSTRNSNWKVKAAQAVILIMASAGILLTKPMNPELGVTGVPGYLFAGGFLLPGAQTAETIGQILQRVKQKLATVS